jgi:hypothetical protein
MSDFLMSMVLGNLTSMIGGLGFGGGFVMIVGALLLLSLTAAARRFFCTPKGRARKRGGACQESQGCREKSGGGSPSQAGQLRAHGLNGLRWRWQRGDGRAGRFRRSSEHAAHPSPRRRRRRRGRRWACRRLGDALCQRWFASGADRIRRIGWECRDGHFTRGLARHGGTRRHFGHGTNGSSTVERNELRPNERAGGAARNAGVRGEWTRRPSRGYGQRRQRIRTGT